MMAILTQGYEQQYVIIYASGTLAVSERKYRATEREELTSA